MKASRTRSLCVSQQPHHASRCFFSSKLSSILRMNSFSPSLMLGLRSSSVGRNFFLPSSSSCMPTSTNRGSNATCSTPSSFSLPMLYSKLLATVMASLSSQRPAYTVCNTLLLKKCLLSILY